MTAVEDTRTAGDLSPRSVAVPPPTPPRGRRRWPVVVAGHVLRFLIFAALAAFLLAYVGPRHTAETSLKVVFAVALTAALWVGANLIFDQAYARWSLFSAVVGGVVGFVGFFVAEANGLFRRVIDEPVSIVGQGVFDDVTGWSTQRIDFNGLAWAAIGGVGLGLVMFLLSAPRRRLSRLPLALAAFAAFGLLASLALRESTWPQLDWAKTLVCGGVGAVATGLVGLWRRGRTAALPSMLAGLGAGWAVGAWGGADLGAGNRADLLLATVVPAAIVGARVGLAPEPDARTRRRIERRARSWIFVTPALGFIALGLLAPLVRTIYLSFRDRRGRQGVGWDNYREIFTNKNSVNLDGWRDMFTSRLWWIALVLIAIGVLAGAIAGRRTSQVFERGPGSLGPILVGFFVLSCAVLASVRGTILNNVWWVIVVVTLATSIGLAVAVLADRARAENAAKSLIFLPMAISFVGAGIIWRFMYQAREVSQEQTGLLNAFWVWVGEVSTSTTARAVAVAVLAVVGLGLLVLVKRGLDTGAGTMAGFSVGFLLVVAYLIYRLVGPGLGGFVDVDGETQARPVLFIQEGPFNNMWMMVVLIWIQSGFAMVILSAAIKAVPTELVEAAKMDGAGESQIFWRITLPQIAPTVGVVVTALFVTVMKVFDIVYVMTNGNFGTQVIANEMWIRAFSQTNLGLGSALAVVLFASVIPIMWINIRRMQRERV